LTKNDNKNSNLKKKNNTLPQSVLNNLQKISRKQSTPLYHQLYQVLYDALKSNELEPGSFFATEVLLQKATGMSRTTIRKAIDEYTKKGMLTRITGKGTYVKLPDVRIIVPELKSLTEELIDRGMKPGAVFLNSKYVTAPEQVEDELKNKKEMLMIERIRTGNGVPILFSTAYFPGDIPLNKGVDFSGSIYELLKEHNHVPHKATHIVGATIITQKIAKSLEIPNNTAGLFIKIKTYDKNENLILYEEGIGRGDLYNYTLSMQPYPQ